MILIYFELCHVPAAENIMFPHMAVSGQKYFNNITYFHFAGHWITFNLEGCYNLDENLSLAVSC